MKKLLTLFVLLYTLAAQSQAITEKDLLGRWKALYINVMGCQYNYDTGEVVLSEKLKSQMLKEGKSIYEAKKIFASKISSTLQEMIIVFTPGFNWKVSQGQDIMESTYIILQNGNNTVLKNNEGGAEFGISKDEDNLLLTLTDASGTNTLVGFKKIE